MKMAEFNFFVMDDKKAILSKKLHKLPKPSFGIFRISFFSVFPVFQNL